MAKDFAKELCRRFVISRDKVHVSIVSYSQYVHIMPKFRDCYDEKSLENALNNQHLYEASSTRTGRTLKVICSDVFNEKRGGARTDELGEQLSSSLSFIHFMLQQCLLYSPVYTNVMQRKFGEIQIGELSLQTKYRRNSTVFSEIYCLRFGADNFAIGENTNV